MLVSRWYHPVRAHDHKIHDNKKVSWLELFYDLIYVAAIIQLGTGLVNNLTVHGLAVFVGLFVPMWVVWIGFTFLYNRIHVDDVFSRLTVFCQMFGVGAMAVAAPHAFDGRPSRFFATYAVVRLLTSLQYYRVARESETLRSLSRYFSKFYLLESLVWIGVAALTGNTQVVGWVLAILLSLSIPFRSSLRSLVSNHTIDWHHLAERFGLLVIIVLGESFVKILSGLYGLEGSLHTMVMASFSLVISCSLWYLYFDDIAESTIKNSSINTVLFWIYAHLPLTLGLTMLGVLTKKIVFFDANIIVAQSYRIWICGSVALILLSLAVLDWATSRGEAVLKDEFRVIFRLISAIAVCALIPLGAQITATYFVLSVALFCAIQVIGDLGIAPQTVAPDHDDLLVATTFTAESINRSQTVRRDVSEAVRIGTPNELRRDLYFFIMEVSWSKLFVGFGLVFLVLNLIFAGLFSLDLAGIAGITNATFADAFNFSVQTFSTIGYGALSPISEWTNTIVLIESITAILATAMATGLTFAKASRPKSSVLFSQPIIYTQFDGQPALMFRVGNARGNDIVEATVNVACLVDRETIDGHKLRHVVDLNLLRSRTPIFALSWSVIHPIDEQSPLFGVNFNDLPSKLYSVIVTMTGYDSVYAQTVHARHIYYPEDFQNNVMFDDVISSLPDGRLSIDYSKFHDTVTTS